MIPERINMKGFLCYRGEQQIALSDLRLCMLSGPNGSGKSTVFDAMTFVLFGETRGGSIHKEDLLNKKCDSASVDLDFRASGALWRARRTLQRRNGNAKSTQGIFRWSEAKDDWEAIPDTASVKGFDNWIAHHVGFTFDTFTSSTLLRQGKADRLINAKPAERHQLLSTAVGLDQYVRLHARTNEQRQRADGECKALAAQLKGLEIVPAEQVEAARAAAETAACALALAEENVGRLQAIQPQAAAWDKFRRELSAAEAELRGCNECLGSAEKIESDWKRLCDLRAALPHLKSVADYRKRLAGSARSCGEWEAERAKTVKARTALAEKADAAAQAQKALGERIMQTDQRERLVLAGLTRLSAVLDSADSVEKQRAELAGLKQKRAAIAGDPEKELEKRKAEHERLAEVFRILPSLRHLEEERSAVAEAHSRLTSAEREAKAAAAEAVSLVKTVGELQRELDGASAAQRKAQQGEADAKADSEQARKALRELERAGGGANCPTCGNELTAEHLSAEQATRKERERTAAAARGGAKKALEAAEAELDRQRKLKAEVDAGRAEAENRAKDRERAARQAGDLLARHLKGCARALGELPELYRAKVDPKGVLPPARDADPADWAATIWPTARDLSSLHADADGLPAAKAAAASAEETAAVWRDLGTRIEVVSAALATRSANLPVDIAALRTEHAALAAERSALRSTLEADRAAFDRQAAALEAMQAEDRDLSKQAEILHTRLSEEKARQEGFHEAIGKAVQALRDLSPAWEAESASDTLCPGRLVALDQEKTCLEFGRAQEALERLTDARAKAKGLGEKMAGLKAEIEALPAAARRDPAEVKRELDEAVASRAARQAELKTAENEHVRLRDRRERRETLNAQFLQAERTQRQYRKLAELLGPKQLQRHLLRRAEREIVQFANAVLDRVSGGDLLLRLRPGEPDQGGPDGGDGGADGNADASAKGSADAVSERVLDLEAVHRKTAEGDAIPVAFLSGSQQFRVAVALALAFGQYAGGGNRLGECVIIDEGFGSLDRQGQAVMIEELQRLQSVMQRIILVSHQESFAEAFSCGYRFSLRDGETKVERIEN